MWKVHSILAHDRGLFINMKGVHSQLQHSYMSMYDRSVSISGANGGLLTTHLSSGGHFGVKCPIVKVILIFDHTQGLA